ncbi:hypothetical protein QC762_0070830 [Podospora pseudocomata]|uniref:Nephrocystin 3-like N-terminal domain-containing protein n=1 Tax=Podospora pseudocomata TaxID=2093779 RepID=A0ABR0GGU5_9PEZI|nr:hypothetical protein QC762_0070830 [Podospora pseudocomata]
MSASLFYKTSQVHWIGWICQRIRGKRESIMIAFRARWNCSKLEDLEKRIESFRQQLVLGLLVTIRNFAMQSLDHEEAPLQRLDGVTQVPRPEQSAPAHALFQHLAHRGGLDNYATDSIRWKTLHSSTLNRVATGQGEMVSPPAIETSFNSSSCLRFLAQTARINDSLKSMKLTSAHLSGFSTKTVKQSIHGTILSNGASKAGSGKSTLMRFISQHPQLMKHLQVWSNGAPVTIASFYFWASGTAMQASSEGLLRPLLYQLLDQHKHIIPKLAPQTWEGTYLFGAPMPMVQADDLRRMLGFTVREVGKISRICLIIDGLDEFGGSTDDVLDTIEAFTSHYIKVCAAIRPWVAFEESFYQKPQLLLQNLTRQDMEDPRYEGTVVLGAFERASPTLRSNSRGILWTKLMVSSYGCVLL